MDFKTRFQGKTSHITKDGGIDDMVLSTSQPINKVNKVSTNQAQNQEQLNQLPSSSSSQSKPKDLSIKVTDGMMKGENYNPNSDSPLSSSYIQTPDLKKDNIYLQGGKTIAEALQYGKSNANSGQINGGSGTGANQSIAMRMKKNRELTAAAVTNGQAQSNASNDYIAANEEKLYSANPFPGLSNQQNNKTKNSQALQSDQQFWRATPSGGAETTYSDNSQVSQQNPNNNNKFSSNPQNLTATALQPPLSGQSNKSSHALQLRQSVEQQRHQKLSQISKEIMSPNKIAAQQKQQSNNANTQNSQNSYSYQSQEGNGSNIQTVVNTNNEKQINFKRQNSLKHSGNFNPNADQLQIIANQTPKIVTNINRQRATSVTNNSISVNNNNNSNLQSQQQQPQQKQQLQKGNTQIKDTNYNRRVNKLKQSQSQDPTNNNTAQTQIYSNRYTEQYGLQNEQVQQQNIFFNQIPPIIPQNGNSNLTPEQINQQIMFMQHQMMLLQQQQQLIQMGQINSIPNAQYQSPLIYQSQQNDSGNDVYRQFELADKKYNEKQINGGASGSKTEGKSTPYSTQGDNMKYKPYTQKDFNNMQSTQQSLKLGGLGPNLGGDDWQKAKQKKDLISDYDKKIKMQISHKPLSQKRKEEEAKDKTSRDKAIEFAKNIPKPKKKIDKQQSENQEDGKEGNNNLGHIDEEQYDEYGNTLVESDLGQLNQKHEHYLNELEKIKQSLF